MPIQMNHDTHTYISVTFAQNSALYHNPEALSVLVPGLSYVGQVGALANVHLYSFPKERWVAARDDVLGGIEGGDGVLHVEVQRPVQRVKRGEEEL
ncbi:hypothetical protein BDN70DRAFT_877016 [Pholiota conissans]|uniref:Uncharacterized protein n=1 Tax=Pholiota conissans TaxID=109636 RepID=A0A9P5Z4S8_9AGAR|nr:hypothetical protein BDN70DRAFT_877016 [Pholiota conissans]